MSRNEEFLNGLNFHFEQEHDGWDDEFQNNSLSARGADGRDVGRMEWNDSEVTSLYVDPAHRRKGIASELWRRANELPRSSVAQPRHSTERTEQGDAWAKQVGGDLPRLYKGRYYPPMD